MDSSKNSKRIATYVLCATTMALDGYDLIAMALAAPYVTPLQEISASMLGAVFSAALIGLGAGALLLAPLGDRFGKRLVILASVLAVTVSTAGTMTGASAVEFMLWRFLTGLGLGACLPNLTSIVAITAPEEKRASLVTIVSVGISLGAIIAGLVAPLLVVLGGWQAIFLPPAILGCLLLAGFWIVLSPDHHQSHVTGSTKADIAPSSVLHPPILKLLVAFCALYSLSACNLYAFMNWLPVIVPRAGFDMADGARSVSLAQAGGVILALGISRMLDLGYGRVAFIATTLGIAVALLLFGALPDTRLNWAVLIFVAGGGIAAMQLSVIAAAAKAFPFEVQATAFGIGVATARLGAVAGPILGGAIVEADHPASVFFALLALPVLLSTCVIVLIGFPPKQLQ